MAARYQGVFPVAPTIFTDDGAPDLDGQRRCLDFMIDAGSQGICIHANYSEQFALGDDERETLTRLTSSMSPGACP
jgi:dihydrodipicolinate synthase/N-acetylneuraminate lyase